MTEQIVIIGAGLAAAKATETLRKEGFAGDVVLIGAEPHRPYERPPLSKGQLLGTADASDAFVHPDGWYADHHVDFRASCIAESIDLARHRLFLSTGEGFRYDRLLIATGSSPIVLQVSGGDLPGVSYLRTLDDSRRISDALREGQRVVVIGGGWIGLEVAAAARQRGADVSVVETAVLPLLRVLGPELAERYADLHRSHGVRLHLGASVRRIEGNARATGVSLADGTVLAADLIVVGVGIRPNADIAARAGIKVDNGIVTDAALRTSDPDVYACGDVANIWHPVLGQHIRVEHWENAKESGKAAARSMLGQADAYVDHLPYFYSDQYDLGMEYFGYVTPSGYDSVVFRGDTSIVDGKAPQFIAFWMQDRRALAAMNANIWDVQPDLQAIVRAGHAGKTVDPVRLADPRIPLPDLLR